MIVGLGIDITELDRIKSSLDKYGERFAEKILTAGELKMLPAKNPVPYVAARFAAKEAAVKALGTGFAEGITFQCIEVTNLESGAPQLVFSGNALERSQELGIKGIHISLTHGRDSAVAVVVLEK
ncbi:holo-[acyl-carrier-protein] synthase [Maridesulfovibrio sp.]|uniref:holo-[acyl-carrier-protein] synthase n=1 Tax=Maridesulfovibrio sp. TaxID=2795000 RepID=UPI002A186C52|nr:holo-[acyl-carrier-protein] synthase [Maridesulfovibrio sp.]